MFNKFKRFLNTQSMWLAYSNIWSQLLYGIAIIYVARQLLPSQFAPVAIAISVIPIAVTFADWGTNSFYLRELSAGRIERNLWQALFRNQIIVAALLGTATALLLSLFIPIAICIVTGLAVFSLQSFQASQVLLRSNGHFGSIAQNNIVYRLPLLTLPICQNFAPELLSAYFVGMVALGQIVGMLNLWTVTRRSLQSDKPRDTVPFSDHWKRSGSVAWIPILTQIKGLDIAIWTALSGPTITGNYGAVSRLSQPTEILAQSAISVEFVRWSKVKRVRDALKLSSSTSVQLLISIFASATLALFGNSLASLLLGDEYVYAGPMLRLVGVASLLSVVWLFLLFLLVAVGLHRYALRGQVLLILTQGMTLYVLAAKLTSPVAGPLALIAGLSACIFYMIFVVLTNDDHAVVGMAD